MESFVLSSRLEDGRIESRYFDPVRTLVVLFKGRTNFGDDLFEFAYQKIAKENDQVSMKIIDIDQLYKIDPKSIDCILFGGGDMFTDFFVEPLKKWIDSNPSFRGPIYAWSVGLPYPSVLTSGSLDMFDHISCRSSLDRLTIEHRLGKESTSSWPDLSTMLDWHPPKRAFFPSCLEQVKRVGICFAYDIIQDKVIFDKTLKRVLRSIESIHAKSPDCEFVWIPFHLSRETEPNDTKIELHVSEKLKSKIFSQCRFLNGPRTVQQMNSIFGSLDFAICGRFHSHVIAIVTCTPFVSIACSPKVKKLLEESGLGHLDFSSSFRLWEQIQGLLKDHKGFVGLLEKISSGWKDASKFQVDSMIRTIASKKRRSSPPYYVSVKESALASRLLENMLSTLDPSLFREDKDASAWIELAKQGKQNFHDLFHRDLDPNKKETLKSFLAETICLHITGKRDPSYLWGLSQQILEPNYKFYESFDWMQKDWYSKSFYCQNHLNIEDPVWSIQWFEKNSFKGYHRCGWEFVVNSLEKMGKYPDKGKLPNTIADGTIVLDTYCDRTFGWENKHFVAMGTLPYKRPWVGFFHHTFDVRFQNNVDRSCSFPSFVESLDRCICFFVLSNALKKDLDSKLSEIGAKYGKKIPSVHMVHHPTDLDVPGFSFERFLLNENKMLVQIGAWLRNPYGIYRVPIEMEDPSSGESVPCSPNSLIDSNKDEAETENRAKRQKKDPVPVDYKNPMKIRKAILKGSNMDNYFRPNEFHLLGSTEPDDIKIDFCRCLCVCDRDEDKKERYLSGTLCDCENKSFNNQFLFGFLQALNEDYSSVKILNKLSNQEYDNLLIENIVFLNLYDVSAANTIIECIARNTPLLVNPLPAAIEYLGEEYPFYYQSFREAADKATNPILIFETHQYLKNMNKSFLNIDSFLFRVSQHIKSDLGSQ